MRHLKSYETLKDKLEFEYKLGDHVYFKGDYWLIKYGKIIMLHHDKLINHYNISYKVEVYDPHRVEMFIFWLDEEEIGRLCTPKEIENFETKKQSLKYNL